MMTNTHNGILYIIYPLAMTLLKYIFMKNSQYILKREHKVLYIWSHFFMEKKYALKTTGKDTYQNVNRLEGGFSFSLLHAYSTGVILPPRG